MRTGFLLLAGAAAVTGGVFWKARDASHAHTPASAAAVKKAPVPSSAAVNVPASNTAFHTPAETALEVTDRLDTLLQPRFLEQTTTFGLSRMYIPLDAHQFTHRDEKGQTMRRPLYDLIGRDDKEKFLIAEANAPQKDYVIGFLHCVNTLGKPGDKPYPVYPAQARGNFWSRFEPLVMHEKELDATYLQDHNKVAAWAKTTLPAFETALAVSNPKADKGENTTDTVGSYVLCLRPVKAQETCLSCHSRAKNGDTLGVLAYVVKK